MLSRRLERRPDGRTIVMLAGIIDETADLEALVADLDGELAFDLSGIQRINSIGAHRWILMMARVTAHRRVVVEAVPYCVGMQANYVANFFARAEVLSCLAPYACDTCDTSVNMLIHRDEVSLRAPTRWCSSCKQELRFDELGGYLDFLVRTRAT
ncbi:MAG: hypothetical protein F9K40_22720 [Kofleriaceae bacterium]|nr:MAG: hypothetical protein F9K40_22720 [Kofleriaceae bacterium]